MTRHAPLSIVWILLLAWLTAGYAQERHHFLAINGALNEQAGPFYFISQGDSGTAFMDAPAFAAAVDLELHPDPDQRRLTLSAGTRWVTIKTTTDVGEGLRRQEGSIEHDRGTLSSPQAIVVAGVTYLPIASIVTALGGTTEWYADERVIIVDLPQPIGGHAIGQPRFGVHSGYSRVAIDIPDGFHHEVRVQGDRLLLLLPNAATTFEIDQSFDDDPHLRAVAFEQIDGMLAIALTPRHPVQADPPMGFTSGNIPKGDGTVAVYVDVGPALWAASLPVEPAAAASSTTASARRVIVVLDPGHGGRDPGAVAPWGYEKDVVLSVALLVQEQLEALGIEVVMTRDDDSFISLQERSTFASNDRTLFVSIHANGANTDDAKGIETFTFGRPLHPNQIGRAIQENGGGDLGVARTAEAEQIANDLVSDILGEGQMNRSDDLARVVQRRLVGATSAENRGVKQNLFYVIRNARIPAVLVELGFITHFEEGPRLMEPSHQERLAVALSEAIVEFLGSGGWVVAQR